MTKEMERESRKAHDEVQRANSGKSLHTPRLPVYERRIEYTTHTVRRIPEAQVMLETMMSNKQRGKRQR